ncbi:MAG: AMP-binding protein, partial [Desulfobacterales bacterium]|nr:AMP-binding protein [Desulfobacterales bacterium]
MGVRDFTIYDVICRNADIYSDRDAIVYKDIRLSHTEFKQKCDQVASGLKKTGINKGDRIGVVAHNSDEYLVLYGAAAKIGAIILAVNWRFQPDEVLYVLNDCTPKIVFAGSEYQQMISELKSKINSIEQCYAIGTEKNDKGFIPFKKLYDSENSTETYDIPMDTGFVIIHTAAVEGKPRGALLSQGNVIYSGLITLKNFNLDIDDCHIGLLPLFHVAGLNLSFAMMQAGGKNAILERFDPGIALQL